TAPWDGLANEQKDRILRRALARRDTFSAEEHSSFLDKALERWPDLSKADHAWIMRRAIGQRGKPFAWWFPSANIHHAWDLLVVFRDPHPDVRKAFNRHLCSVAAQRQKAVKGNKESIDSADIFRISPDALCIAALHTLQEVVAP